LSSAFRRQFEPAITKLSEIGIQNFLSNLQMIIFFASKKNSTFRESTAFIIKTVAESLQTKIKINKTGCFGG